MEGKRKYILGLFFLLITLSNEYKAQHVQLFAGIDAYSWNKTPKLDSTNTFVSSGNVALNPNIGLSFAFDTGINNYYILNTALNYSITSISLGKNKSFGSINLPISTGLGFYGGRGTYLQVLYGYQFNFIDLYGINKDFTRKELQFNTHFIECSVGLGDDGYRGGFGTYFRFGFNLNGAFTINTGVRVGFKIN